MMVFVRLKQIHCYCVEGEQEDAAERVSGRGSQHFIMAWAESLIPALLITNVKETTLFAHAADFIVQRILQRI